MAPRRVQQVRGRRTPIRRPDSRRRLANLRAPQLHVERRAHRRERADAADSDKLIEQRPLEPRRYTHKRDGGHRCHNNAVVARVARRSQHLHGAAVAGRARVEPHPEGRARRYYWKVQYFRKEIERRGYESSKLDEVRPDVDEREAAVQEPVRPAGALVGGRGR